ncbi:hypothetical protein JHK82_018893 [Glycine max]|nr:hypothetical protein JHK82_018893 [Glycine max]
MNENDHEEEDDNDVIEVYENEHEEEDDARLEDEDEVDCEVQNDDYGDYDDFWIPSLLKDECISFETIVDIRQFDMEKMSVEDVSRLDFAELELAYVFYFFAAAIVTDETEETYVWLLEQFLETMKGKTPCSIITDGDLAMRNAITRVMAEWMQMEESFVSLLYGVLDEKVVRMNVAMILLLGTHNQYKGELIRNAERTWHDSIHGKH